MPAEPVHWQAQDMGKKHSAELSVKVVDYPNMVYASWIQAAYPKMPRMPAVNVLDNFHFRPRHPVPVALLV